MQVTRATDHEAPQRFDTLENEQLRLENQWLRVKLEEIEKKYGSSKCLAGKQKDCQCALCRN